MSVNADDLNPLARLYKALGDETRLHIVALLSHGELCVCHIEAALEMPQPTVSRHLAVLRNAEVVEARRQGSWIYYRLARNLPLTAQQQLRALVRAFGKRADLQREVARLVKSCGPGACK